ncbi:hypothetical protein V494_01374 [Pseudogymnoascus sp. VKM F-4513 (FW-928)]|nr:hypothetical protein V494_01374 [Pseudogymnoascus sp. VKM F-4513 (FW-928)]
MGAEHVKIKPLLLIGGQSLRMGTRKELLTLPNGRLALECALETLWCTIPNAPSVYLSLHDESQLDAVWLARQEREQSQSLPFATVPIFDNQDHDIGPAAGLLAAHAMFPATSFLVLGCDYPLITPEALKQLMFQYVHPVTCFSNDEGFSEPLIAIWAPEALEKLKENVKRGRNGLNEVIKQIGGNTATPIRKQWIKGTNTRKEWDEAMELLSNRQSDSYYH